MLGECLGRRRLHVVRLLQIIFEQALRKIFVVIRQSSDREENLNALRTNASETITNDRGIRVASHRQVRVRVGLKIALEVELNGVQIQWQKNVDARKINTEQIGTVQED